MNASYDQLREARTALDTPLFAGLPGDINVSFEFFPPKSDALMAQLWDVVETDRKSTRLNSSHIQKSRMPSSA